MTARPSMIEPDHPAGERAPRYLDPDGLVVPLTTADPSRAVGRLAARLRPRRQTLAVAESLTGGRLSSTFAAGPHAHEWLAGAVVAYTLEVKRRLLGYTGTQPYSRECAEAMAEGVRRRMASDFAVAVTGVGGPASQGGVEAGTVWVAFSAPGEVRCRRLQLSGSPEEVIDLTCAHAVSLVDVLTQPARVG